MPRGRKRANVDSSVKSKPNSKTPKVSDTDMYDFTSAKSYTDLVLQVEGKSLHVSKSLLMMASPVFQKMFESDFCEKSKNCIDLPEKNFDDFHFLLQFLVPGCRKKLTYDVALKIYPLAHEYQMEEIKNTCVDILVKTADSFRFTRDQFIEWYSLAARYNLESLQIALTEHLTELDTDIMEEMADTNIDMTVPWSVCQSLLKCLARDREKLLQHEEVLNFVRDLFSEHSNHCKSRHMTCCQHKCEPVNVWINRNSLSTNSNTSMTPQCWQRIVCTLMQSDLFNKWFDMVSDHKY